MKMRRDSQKMGFVLGLLCLMAWIGCTGNKTTTPPAPEKIGTTAVSEVELDSILYVVHCGDYNCVLQGGGLSIIYIIDNVGGGDDPAYFNMKEYCAIGRTEEDAPAQDRRKTVGDGETCDPLGSMDFSASTPIKVPAAHWCAHDRLHVIGNCLIIPMDGGVTVGIDLVRCSAQLTFEGDSISIRSGCPGNTATSSCR